MDTARYVRLVLAVGGNVFIVLSALFSLGTYTSGDPSGLQYLFLVPAIGLLGSCPEPFEFGTRTTHRQTDY